MKSNKFLSLLFNPDEGTCFTSKPRGVSVRVAPLPSDIFFSINPINLKADIDPRADWHKADKPRRADCNVIAYRNFLIELDEMELGKQIDYITSVFPVSSIVYSGGKSYHAIISLQEDLPDYETYMRWSTAILKTLPEADPTMKNPSRLSRLPGVIRPETGKKQELVYLGERISNHKIEEIISRELNRVNILNQLDSPDKKQRISVDLLSAIDNPNRLVLKFGSRNKFFYWLSHRFKELNMDKAARRRCVNKAYSNLESQSGFSLDEAYEAGRVK